MTKFSAALLALFILAISSCKKDDSTTPPPAQKSKEELLTAKGWKFQSITFAQDSKLYYYERGGSANTANFTNDLITFKTDGSGTYTATGIDVFNITWQFLDAAKSKMKYTILNYDLGVRKNGVNQIVVWENVLLTETSLDYAEIYTRSDNKAIISSARRVPQ